jgi:hypothetical protein
MESGGTLKQDLDLAIATIKEVYEKDGDRTMPDSAALALATQTLIDVRRTLDGFRDESRAGLARTRIHLIWAGLMTAVVAYILLALAIFDDVPTYQVVAGAAFFLVGAVSGLIWQLRQSGSKIRSGEDDFGLDMARLVYVPVLSGLAGVGGVLILAMLYPTLNVVPETSNAADVGSTVPEIASIFDLSRNRFGLLVAAVFGLTPDLLINRLQGEADRYRRQLEATSVQTRSNESSTAGEETLKKIFDKLEALPGGAPSANGGTEQNGAAGGTGQNDTAGGAGRSDFSSGAGGTSSINSGAEPGASGGTAGFGSTGGSG